LMSTDLLKGIKLWILVLLISFASISAVLFVPSLPSLATDFGLTESTAQWSMTIFLIGYTVGQLPYGPIANRWGRKKVIFIGLDLALVGTLLSVFATHFWLFCLGRLFQALGAAVGLKISFTMIGDQHKGPSATKALSYVMLAFSIMPGIGIALGGFLTVGYGWRGCFAFLSIYTLLLSFLCRLLPETAKSIDKEALLPRKIVQGLHRSFKDPLLILHALLMGLGTSFVYVFATAAPYLGIEQIGLSPDVYGLWNLLPSIGMGIGLLISAQLATRVVPRIGMMSGILLSLIGIIALNLLFAGNFLSAATLFVPTMLIQIGSGISYSGASGKAVSEITDKSNGSAVLSFVNMAVATVAVSAMSIVMPISALGLGGIFALLIVMQVGVWLALKSHRVR